MSAPVTIAPAEAQAQTSAKASMSPTAQVLSPNGTLAIQLMPAPITPIPPLPFYLNTAIIVPIVTLLGVGVTVWLGWWKTQKELKASDNKWTVDRQDARTEAKDDRIHAAEEARKARLVVARREVYLELIKEMTAASMALGGMPFKKGNDLDVQGGFQGFLSAVARVAILGEMDTVVKSRELMNLVQKILYKKLPEINQMKAVKAEQERFEQLKKQQIEKSNGLKTVMTDLLKDISRNGPTSHSRVNDVKPWEDALSKSDADAKMYGEDAAELDCQHVLLAKAYQRAIIEDTAEIAQKTNELIVCIRSELELSSDFALLESSTEVMYATAKESIEKMQAHYEN